MRLNFTDSMTKSISFFSSDAFYTIWILGSAKLQLKSRFQSAFFLVEAIDAKGLAYWYCLAKEKDKEEQKPEVSVD